MTAQRCPIPACPGALSLRPHDYLGERFATCDSCGSTRSLEEEKPMMTRSELIQRHGEAQRRNTLLHREAVALAPRRDAATETHEMWIARLIEAGGLETYLAWSMSGAEISATSVALDAMDRIEKATAEAAKAAE
jgi:hypothetical protein